MNVEAFLICDAATDQLGKLNVLGSFDTIHAVQLPFVYPQFTVALRIRFFKTESGNHPFRINVINADGKSIMPKPLDGNVNIEMQPKSDSQAVNLVVNLRDVRFEAEGSYSVDLTMDGKQRGSLPLTIRKAGRE